MSPTTTQEHHSKPQNSGDGASALRKLASPTSEMSCAAAGFMGGGRLVPSTTVTDSSHARVHMSEGSIHLNSRTCAHAPLHCLMALA